MAKRTRFSLAIGLNMKDVKWNSAKTDSPQAELIDLAKKTPLDWKCWQRTSLAPSGFASETSALPHERNHILVPFLSVLIHYTRNILGNASIRVDNCGIPFGKFETARSKTSGSLFQSTHIPAMQSAA
jgi:hypothetical protein